MSERMKANEESCMREQQTCPLTIHFNMWVICSDVSIQRRHWQSLSVHLWAYCIHPAHDGICVGWLQHRSLRPLLFSNSGVPQEPDMCNCCEMGPTDFRPYPRSLESLTVGRCHYKGSTFFLVKDPECLSGRVSNPWPPVQQTGALQTEPTRGRLI